MGNISTVSVNLTGQEFLDICWKHVWVSYKKMKKSCMISTKKGLYFNLHNGFGNYPDHGCLKGLCQTLWQKIGICYSLPNLKIPRPREMLWNITNLTNTKLVCAPEINETLNSVLERGNDCFTLYTDTLLSPRLDIIDIEEEEEEEEVQEESNYKDCTQHELSVVIDYLLWAQKEFTIIENGSFR